MEVTTVLKRFCYRAGYAFFYVYWFLFRPTMIGVQIVLKKGGSYFLIRHSYKNFGKWDFVGGGAKGMEKPEETMLRELWEETGLVPANWKYIGFASIYADYHTSNVHMYEVEIFSDEIILDKGEILEGKWFARHEIGNNLSAFSRIQWQKYIHLVGE